MAQKLVYVELKSGYSHNGPAWIGYGNYNRTGNTLYFNGQILRKGTGVSGNYYDFDTHDEYWVSGVKRNGSDRHGSGNGKINIDSDVVPEYLALRNIKELPSNLYTVVSLIKTVAKEHHTNMTNEKL